MASAKPTFTTKQFDELVPKLEAQLTAALKKELRDCALSDPATDLWDLPTVDSKTVCKLSPVVKVLIGVSLKAAWVRKGGYKSIDEAVQHVIDQLRMNCVLDVAHTVAAVG